MAITATRLYPPRPEILPAKEGMVAEVWQLTFDGAAGSVVITAETMRFVAFATQPGGSNNIVANNSSKSVTFTFTTGQTPVNGATAQVVLYGKI